MTDEELYALYLGNGRNASACAEALGVTPSQARKRVSRIKRERGEQLTIRDDQFAERVNRLAELEERSSIPESILATAEIDSLQLAGWGTSMKIDGQPFKDGLYSTRVKYRFPKQKSVVEWPPIAPYYNVEARAYVPLPAPVTDDFERTFVWGDTQIHFWRESGNLVPFHDEAAIDAGLQALARYRPHRVVIIGDLLDLPGLGRFRKEPAFAFLMNAAIAYATHLIARIRAIVGPDCEIVFVPGNHEARLEIAILENLMELYGVKRPGDAFSLLSIPYLLSFEKYDIRCLDQFPSGIIWLADDLCCMHKPDKSVAATQVCGHLVKGTVASESLHFRDGRRTFKTIIVPGFGDYSRVTNDKQRIQRTNIPSHLGRSGAEQAFATIDITQDRKRHSVKVWDIEDGAVMFREHGLLQGVAEGWTYDEAA